MSSNDPVLEKIAGANYKDKIRIPIDTEGQLDTLNSSKPRVENTSYDFGTVVEGEKVDHLFTISNSSKTPLYILEARTSCGCTVTEYEKGAIHEGQFSEIRVTFDTSDKNGHQEKNVRILTNGTPHEIILKIRGEIISKTK